MIGGVLASDRLVVCRGDDLVAAHHDCTDGDFVLSSGAPRLLERGGHAFMHAPSLERVRTSANSRPSLDRRAPGDRKSTRLNSSHVRISYAVFCLKKKK